MSVQAPEATAAIERQSNYNSVYYEQVISSARSSRTVRLEFPAQFTDRVASASGRCRPIITVAAARDRLRNLSEVNFPSSLQGALDDFVEQVEKAEHDQAVQAGQLPLPNDIYRTFRDAGMYGIGIQYMARAHEYLQDFNETLPQSAETIRLAAQLALKTVALEDHDEDLSAAEAKLEAMKTELETAQEELARVKSDAQDAKDTREFVEELHVDLSSFADRLRCKDLQGTYGNDDFEKMLDLIEPSVEGLRSKLDGCWGQ